MTKMKDFDEVLKQLSYEEWRRKKIINRYEVLTDPQASVWDYVDETGTLHNDSEKTNIYNSTDEILDQIENQQNILNITHKRRFKFQKGSDQWILFTEKIISINKKISELNKQLGNKTND